MSKDLSLYIHIPFCRQKCLYCDFPSQSGCEDLFEAYIKSLEFEMLSAKNHLSQYSIDTVFIGGGTPTVLSAELLGRVCNSIFGCFDIKSNAEITCEANPGTINARKLTEMKAMDINRLSIGVQSFDDEILKRLGRIHNSSTALKNIAEAQKAGFKNINCDLMFALPMQSLLMWQNTVQKAVSLGIQHISAYSLIVENGTAFKTMYEKGIYMPTDETIDRQMYYTAREILKDNGFNQYEISNFACAGFESRHNKAYWQTKEYIGFGLGSHSYFNGDRFHNTYDLKKYIHCNGNIQLLREDTEHLSKSECMEEFMFMGLRMTEGIKKEEFKRRFDKNIEAVYGNEIALLKEEKLLREESDKLCLTEKGMDISNYVFEKFIISEQ